MDTSLESVLSGTATTSTAAADAGATQQQETATSSAAAGTTDATGAGESTATGEQGTASPAVEPRKQLDPIDMVRKSMAAEIAAERQRREAAETELQRLKQPAQQPQKQADDTAGKPLRGQFATEDEWLDARDAWRDQKNAEAAREAQEATQRQEREQQLQRVADDIVGKGKQQYPDFDAVINEGLGPALDATRPPEPGALPMLQVALLQSERGHEVAYWLGKNPAEAWRVAALNPWQMARELTLIETKLDATQPAATPAKPAPQLPQTLTQQRNAQGRYQPAYSGPTPLNEILK